MKYLKTLVILIILSIISIASKAETCTVTVIVTNYTGKMLYGSSTGDFKATCNYIIIPPNKTTGDWVQVTRKMNAYYSKATIYTTRIECTGPTPTPIDCMLYDLNIVEGLPILFNETYYNLGITHKVPVLKSKLSNGDTIYEVRYDIISNGVGPNAYGYIVL